MSTSQPFRAAAAGQVHGQHDECDRTAEYAETWRPQWVDQGSGHQFRAMPTQAL